MEFVIIFSLHLITYLVDIVIRSELHNAGYNVYLRFYDEVQRTLKAVSFVWELKY